MSARGAPRRAYRLHSVSKVCMRLEARDAIAWRPWLWPAPRLRVCRLLSLALVYILLEDGGVPPAAAGVPASFGGGRLVIFALAQHQGAADFYSVRRPSEAPLYAIISLSQKNNCGNSFTGVPPPRSAAPPRCVGSAVFFLTCRTSYGILAATLWKLYRTENIKVYR